MLGWCDCLFPPSLPAVIFPPKLFSSMLNIGWKQQPEALSVKTVQQVYLFEGLQRANSLQYSFQKSPNRLTSEPRQTIYYSQIQPASYVIVMRLEPDLFSASNWETSRKKGLLEEQRAPAQVQDASHAATLTHMHLIFLHPSNKLAERMSCLMLSKQLSMLPVRMLSAWPALLCCFCTDDIIQDI